MTEAEAIACLQRGDLNGLELLMCKYQVKAIRTAYLITRDRAMAQDVVQTAFVQAFERIHQFQIGRPFEPWFLRCVINQALKNVKNSRRQIQLPDDETAAQFLTLVQELDPAESIEAKTAIHSALDKLSADQRAVIILHYYLELDENEISHELACPPGTVKSRLHYARRRLKQLLRPIG